MDCSPPGSSVHGISQARILEWVAISSSRDPPDPGMEPTSPTLQVVPCIAGILLHFFTGWATREAHFKVHLFQSVFLPLWVLLHVPCLWHLFLLYISFIWEPLSHSLIVFHQASAASSGLLFSARFNTCCWQKATRFWLTSKVWVCYNLMRFLLTEAEFSRPCTDTVEVVCIYVVEMSKYLKSSLHMQASGGKQIQRSMEPTARNSPTSDRLPEDWASMLQKGGLSRSSGWPQALRGWRGAKRQRAEEAVCAHLSTGRCSPTRVLIALHWGWVVWSCFESWKSPPPPKKKRWETIALSKYVEGTSVVVQWLRVYTSTADVRGRSLVQELKSFHDEAKKLKLK